MDLVKEGLYDTTTSSLTQGGFDFWIIGLVKHDVEQSLDNNPFQEQAKWVPW
jgi:hypothetical protein